MTSPEARPIRGNPELERRLDQLEARQIPSEGIVIGDTRIFRGANGHLYQRTKDGTETDLSLGAGVGQVVVYDDGTLVVLTSYLNFCGAGVVATEDPPFTAKITIPGIGGAEHHDLGGLLDDDHTQYQKESEKDAASGYCGLDAGALVPDGKIPSGITRDTEHGDFTPTGHSNLIEHADISPAEGFVRKTAAGTYTAHKSNLNAAVDPTVNDDSGDGYSVGSVWINTTADKVWQCVDSTVGAAVWKDLSTQGAGGGGGTAITDADSDTKVDTEESPDEDIIRMDVAGTEEVTVSASGMTVVSNLAVCGTAIDASIAVRVNAALGSSGSFTFASFGGSATASGSSVILTGIAGNAALTGIDTATGLQVRGLDFAVGITAPSSGTCTFSNLILIRTQAQITVNEANLNLTNYYGMYLGPSSILVYTGRTLAITNWYGIYVVQPSRSGSGTLNLTTLYGIYIPDVGTVNSLTYQYGLRIANQTKATNSYILELGPATPYLRLLGNWTAAANATPLYLSEGATPTLRQLKTKDGASIGGGDLVCVLV